MSASPPTIGSCWDVSPAPWRPSRRERPQRGRHRGGAGPAGAHPVLKRLLRADLARGAIVAIALAGLIALAATLMSARKVIQRAHGDILLGSLMCGTTVVQTPSSRAQKKFDLHKRHREKIKRIKENSHISEEEYQRLLADDGSLTMLSVLLVEAVKLALPRWSPVRKA